MSIFSLLALAVAFGVFAGQAGYDLVSGAIAEHRDRKRHAKLLAGVRARVAATRQDRNEERRPLREGPHPDGAKADRMRGDRP